MNDNYYRHINGVPYKMHCFIEMQFAAYFYTVVPYQALFRLPIYKNSAISKSGAIFLSFCKIREFGSPTIEQQKPVWHLKEYVQMHSMGAEVNEQLRLYRTCDFVQ